jgi:hypothetical protein
VGAATAMLVLAACGGDETAGNGSGYAAPADDFCGDLIDVAIPRPERPIVDSWIAGGDVDGDESATTATCAFTGNDHQIEVVVRVGDGAEAAYDEAAGELEGGAVGFEDPEVSSLDGWWAAGQRFEAAGLPVRVADVLWGDDAYARVQVFEFGDRRGPKDPRRLAAVELAEAMTSVVPEVLGRE